MLTSPPKRPKRCIKDIATWLEAFSIYCLILVSYFPHRRKDLLHYQLLILQTYRQFSSWVWLSCDGLLGRMPRSNSTARCSAFTPLAGPLALPVILWLAKTSPMVLLRLRSSANPGITVIAWPLQHPAVLPTSVPAVMARTGLQFTRPTRPPSPARFPSVLPTHRLLGPAANPVVCRLTPPLSYYFC